MAEPRAGAMCSRTPRCGRYGCCTCLACSALERALPGDRWVGQWGRMDRRHDRHGDRGSAEEPVAEIESAGWVGNLSSAARELKAQPLRTPHRAPAASQSPPRAPLEPDRPRPRATLQTPQRRAAALSSPAKSSIAQYSLIVQFHVSERHRRVFCDDETSHATPAASPA